MANVSLQDGIEMVYGVKVEDVQNFHKLYQFLIYKGYINKEEFEEFKRFLGDEPKSTF